MTARDTNPFYRQATPDSPWAYSWRALWITKQGTKMESSGHWPAAESRSAARREFERFWEFEIGTTRFYLYHFREMSPANKAKRNAYMPVEARP